MIARNDKKSERRLRERESFSVIKENDTKRWRTAVIKIPAAVCKWSRPPRGIDQIKRTNQDPLHAICIRRSVWPVDDLVAVSEKLWRLEIFKSEWLTGGSGVAQCRQQAADEEEGQGPPTKMGGRHGNGMQLAPYE